LIKNRDVTPIIQNLHRMLHKNQPGSQKAVDERMVSTVTVLGMSPSNLRDYLVEYRDLHPDTKTTIRKNKLNKDKSVMIAYVVAQQHVPQLSS
jgi:hypothetical protein